MLPLLREFFKTKLQLGYILCFLAVASLFLSAQKSLAPRITADYSFKGVAQFSTEGAYISQCSRLTALKLSQKIASLGHVYAEYGKGALSFSFHPLFATCAILALFLTSPDLAAFAKQAVGGNIIESIINNNNRDSSISFGILMNGIGVAHESHRLVLTRQLSDWCAQANAMSPEAFALSDLFDPANSPLKPHKNPAGALSINARQYISIERYVAATDPICSSQITADVSTDPELGIEPDIKQW
jgi:hypothetical protein